jgi:hypothetical protein
MHERSKEIGGRLKVLSAAGAGTEIDLIVPAAVAFEPLSLRRLRGWLARLYSRGENKCGDCRYVAVYVTDLPDP